MPLATLGFFVFHTATIPYHGIDRSQSWRHPHKSIVGSDSPPPSQYTGKEPDTITIQAELRPEVTGGDGSIDWLRDMADSGQPYPLILGTGTLLGSYVITHYLNIHPVGDELAGMQAVAIYFLCGLPGWFLVRALFYTMEKYQQMNIIEILEKIRRGDK